MAATPPLAPASATDNTPWRGFSSGLWEKDVKVRDFIQQNYTPFAPDQRGARTSL